MARSDPPCVCDSTNGKTSANAEHSTTRNPRDANFLWTNREITEDVTAFGDRSIWGTYPRPIEPNPGDQLPERSSANDGQWGVLRLFGACKSPVGVPTIPE